MLEKMVVQYLGYRAQVEIINLRWKNIHNTLYFLQQIPHLGITESIDAFLF